MLQQQSRIIDKATIYESAIVLCDDLATVATKSSKYNINSFIFTKYRYVSYLYMS